MGFINNALYFFTPYCDVHERAVGTFFKSLNEHSNRLQTHARLGVLLQRNIAVINLWTEYRYKGYHYLRKSERRRLYGNLQFIVEDFERFYRQQTENIEPIPTQTATTNPQKLILLRALMAYFSPKHGVYEYRESSSFGRLLRNPAHEKLIGDCNQIVTLYIYLYSRYSDVHDLQLRILPGHVALHYNGIDIETTNGTYADYGDAKGSILLPIEEIVSTNLLDTTDSYLSTHEIAASDFLEASRFAFVLSHERNIVTQNLKAAYIGIVNTLMNRHNYKRALEFAGKSGNQLLLATVGHNGALYEIKRHNYTSARHYAAVADDRDELIQTCWHLEGIHYYQAHHYHEAIKAFGRSGDQAQVQHCYEALFFEEQTKLGSDLTTHSLKGYAKNIKRMHMYAKKSGNKELIEHANTLVSHL